MDRVDLNPPDPLGLFPGLDQFRSEYKALLSTIKTLKPDMSSSDAFGLAVVGAQMASIQLPLPAVLRVVQALAQSWDGFVANPLVQIHVMVFDGRYVVEPFWNREAGRVDRRAFGIQDLENVDINTLHQAVIYTVIDVRYAMALIQASLHRPSTPDGN